MQEMSSGAGGPGRRTLPGVFGALGADIEGKQDTGHVAPHSGMQNTGYGNSM